MSTSSLTALPSSYPERSDTVEVPEPPRPARKTYGRRREPTPPIENDGPSLSSMFTTSRSPPRPSDPTRDSHSKTLLNRWSTGDAAWKTSLFDLGMGKDAEEDDEEVDAEEIQREIELMRKKARGAKSSPKRVELPAPTHEVAPRKFPVARLQAATSSSTLTTAPPTSPLRSSPPPSVDPPIERGSSPTSIPTGKAQALVNLFDTSSQEEQPEAPHASSTQVSHRSTTPTPATREHRAPVRSVTSSPRSDASETPVKRIKPRKNRLDAFMADLDVSEEASAPPPRMTSRVGSSPNAITDFLATLDQSDEEEDRPRPSAKKSLAKTSSDHVDLFDEEEEERERAVRAGQSKIKGLKKKELEDMRRNMAEAQRNKRVEPFKPEVSCLPISSWAANAAAYLSNKNGMPALVKEDHSPVSSPHQVTPEEITAFTPSSTAREDQKRQLNSKRQMIVPGTSSPTPLVLGAEDDDAGPADWDQEGARLPTFGELMAEDRAKTAKAEQIEARRRILERRKQDHMKALKWTGGGGHSDDELSIIPKAQPAVRFVDIKPTAGRTARNVIDNFVNASGPSRQRQALQFTGRRSSGKEELTETMAEFAGKTFKHADLRTTSGGSRPAGQKANKAKAITPNDLGEMMRERHRQQAQKIQEKKEKAFGARKRPMPSREAPDLEAQIEELRAREASRLQYDQEEEADEDEDEDDEDYQGSDEEEVDGGDEEEVQYSGEEDAIEAGVVEDEQSETGTEIDVDQENQPTSHQVDKIADSIEQDSPVKSSTIPTHQESTPRPSREPLAEVQPTQNNATPQGLDSTFVDISGFGSGGGSPGFSQLFEATQAGDLGADAFAGLRDQGVGLMPTQALLPHVDISATQIERDNAIIAAEAEADLEIQEEMPKTQYLNDRGFFTQTKPQPRPAVEASSSRNNLAGSSSLFDFAPQSAPEIELSSTQRDASETELEVEVAGGSQTGNSASPRRQRSPSTAESEDDEETEVRPANAFDRIMAADQRPLTKHQKQAKARIRSNLVDEQADESDEDNWLMPGQKNDDEEEEDEDQDAYLAELVNDEEISEEDRMRQDALVAQKNREIQLADDAKREAEARKVTEGQYRTKRRGKDFYSDDEDGTPRKKRWSKKQMRQRRDWKEDGLERLDGEENVFMKHYEQDLDSDVESVDEAPSPRAVAQSPVAKLSERERRETIRRVAEMNKSRGDDDIELDLDTELGFNHTVDADTDTSDVETLEETQYSVSRVSRHSKIIEQGTTSKMSIRSTESYQNFVRDESLVTRRVGSIGGASVVYNSKEILPSRPGWGSKQYNGRPPTKPAGSSSSGSILLSKTNKFA